MYKQYTLRSFIAKHYSVIRIRRGILPISFETLSRTNCSGSSCCSNIRKLQIFNTQQNPIAFLTKDVYTWTVLYLSLHEHTSDKNLQENNIQNIDNK